MLEAGILNYRKDWCSQTVFAMALKGECQMIMIIIIIIDALSRS